jgi:hypothetical protein
MQYPTNKMKNAKILLMCTITITITCCTTLQPTAQQTVQPSEEEIMKSWIGHHKSEVILSWGPPNGGTTSDGKAGEVLMYNSFQQITLPPLQPGLPYLTKSFTDYKYVYCDVNGKIYHISWGRK